MQICKVKIEKKAKNNVFCMIFVTNICIFEIIVVPLQPALRNCSDNQSNQAN